MLLLSSNLQQDNSTNHLKFLRTNMLHHLNRSKDLKKPQCIRANLSLIDRSKICNPSKLLMILTVSHLLDSSKDQQEGKHQLENQH